MQNTYILINQLHMYVDNILYKPILYTLII